jgi:AraC-like DNA-binding protein
MRKGDKREQITVWRLDDLAGIELRSGIAVTEPYPRHWHEEYQFCSIQAGGGELFYRGVHHETPPTSLFVVHPGEVHSNQTEIGCSFRSIYMAPELIHRAISSVIGREQNLPFFPNPMIFDEEIIALYHTLHLSLENSGTTLERESIMLEMLTKLNTRHAQEQPQLKSPGKEHWAVKKIREYIIEYHARNISLEELARLAHLSPFHLTRVFTKEVGMPPHAFQTQVRVARAKKLIRNGLSLSGVATMTGFADQSHLIRHFKRLVKITPGEYSKTAKTFNTGFRSMS